MSQSTRNVSKWIPIGLYLFAFSLLAAPAVDLITTVIPLRPSEFEWRYGFLGLLPGYLHTPMLGGVLAMGVAYWMKHRTTLRGLSALALAGAGILALAMAMFALDVVQMRGVRPDEVKDAVLAGGLVQEFKYLMATLALGFLGLGGWKTAAGLGPRERKGSAGVVPPPTDAD